MGKRSISLNNPWFVTLISTMVGIIAGLYITSYFQENKMYTAKEKALEQVQEELKDNYTLLTDFHEKLAKNFTPMATVLDNLNEEMELVLHKDSLSSFLKTTDIVFDYEASKPINNTLVKLEGDLNFNIESGLIGKKLSDIVWDSFKQTDFLSITNFSCITDVEAFYVLQKEVNTITESWKNKLFKTNFTQSKEASEDFMSDWRAILLKQKLLLDYYTSIDDVLENCK
jgi:uncharacterized membrane-anchored protein YhcB (DUF1043 family)